MPVSKSGLEKDDSCVLNSTPPPPYPYLQVTFTTVTTEQSQQPHQTSHQPQLLTHNAAITCLVTTAKAGFTTAKQ
jgi:hypothetical protein